MFLICIIFIVYHVYDVGLGIKDTCFPMDPTVPSQEDPGSIWAMIWGVSCPFSESVWIHRVCWFMFTPFASSIYLP